MSDESSEIQVIDESLEEVTGGIAVLSFTDYICRFASEAAGVPWNEFEAIVDAGGRKPGFDFSPIFAGVVGALVGVAGGTALSVKLHSE